MKKIGVIVNPIAGIGGRVGLKGSDGEFIQKKALALGAQPEALQRATNALKVLHQIDEPFELITCPEQMGEWAVKEAGFVPTIIGEPCTPFTTATDTERAATEMMLRKVDLILFAGGDGTARDIYSAVAQSVPVLGIPAGVKIHSGVYAVNPEGAGQTVVQFISGKLNETREAEVMDLDEEAYRQGRVSAKLYGYMKVPANTKCVQSVKVRSHSEASMLNGICKEVVNTMEPGTLYIIGPGTTTRRIMELLGLNNTLIGVDVVCNGKLIANDISEQYLWHLVENKPAQIVITAIGGQGHILGRGNQQISPRIIKKVGINNIQIVATTEKLLSICQKRLLVDTGDSALNEALCGFKKVITGYRESTMCRVAN